MPEYTNFESKFDDIDMLEIPDDDDGENSNENSISSETEGISDSSDSSKNSYDQSSPVAIFKSDKEYIDLSDWLNTQKTLEFKFEAQKYRKGTEKARPFDEKYISYINNIFKTIEKLTEDDITRFDLEEDDSPIGLVMDLTGSRAKQVQKFQKIDEAFKQIIDYLQNLVNSILREEQESYDFQCLQHVLYILECFEANNFYFDIQQKPELIIKWVNTFDPKPDPELLNDVMVNTPQPYLHPQFWNTCISQLLTRGLFTQIHEVIEYSQYHELKEKCPELHAVIGDMDTLLSNYTSHSSKGQFTAWKLLACEFRDSLSSVRNESITETNYKLIIDQIYDLACIFTGLPKTISSYCDTWYEVYLALSLYQIRDSNEVYVDYFKTAVSEKPPSDIFHDENEDIDGLTEACFLNILENNYLKVLETLHELDPPTTAYLAELMELRLLLRGYYFDVTVTSSASFEDLLNRRTVSEYFLTRHAYDCLNIHELVPVGIGLLLNNVVCTSNNATSTNRKVIAAFLPNYICNTNDDLEWALTICANLNLVSTARQLYYQAGLKSLKDGYIYEALNNFVNCYDPTLLSGENHSEGMKKVHYIVWDLIFSNCLVRNRPIEDDLINNIVDKKVNTNIKMHPVIQQCLAPYAVLKEFYETLPQRDIKLSNKLSKLIHLLKFNYLPKKFVPLLLAQFIPFLIDPNTTFQLPDLVIIIELLDNYESDRNEKELTEGADLYLYSINNIGSGADENDWRKLLGKDNLPKDVDLFTRMLRNQIAAKVGKVFI